jgi:asparagine synthase (glutamine-hydrolysing)
MCGVIFALFSNEDEREHIMQCVDHIKHRGPDNTAVVQTDSYVMGFHRLKIIGTTDTGNQPFVDDEVTFACNGEIYNYNELRIAYNRAPLKSDVDIIPSLLRMAQKGNETEDALDTFKMLDGDFACVYVDEQYGRQHVVVARDRVGLCPLFYGLDEENRIVAFASEAKAIPSFCKQIRPFPPGHFLEGNLCDGLKEEFVCYSNEGDEEKASNNVRVVVEAAVQKRLRHSDRPVGVLCSGGLDSSIVAAITNRHTVKANIFTISYDSGMSYDSFYARQQCADLKNCVHTNVVFTKEDVINSYEAVIKVCETSDPRTIRAAIPGYLLAKYIAENTDIKVILSGEGADELFAGYKYFRYCPDAQALVKETTRLVNQLYSFDVLRAERVFSAFGLELRVPFLDQTLIQTVSLYSHITFDHIDVEKYLLRKAFEGYPELACVIKRQKECFSDGCGYNYVPDLLRLHSDASRLDLKEKDEKNVYKGLFEKYYGQASWILDRTMPDWIPKVDSTSNNLCMH